jgi:NDP-sugar pyrophosphorylase family protein
MPAAGLGSRFATAGITKPKPLIEVLGKPMVRWAADSFPTLDDDDFLFIIRQAHVDQYNLDARLKEIFTPEVDIVVIDHLTEGPACTAAKAERYVDEQAAVVITDCDHYFEAPAFYDLFENPTDDIVGAIPVYRSEDESNSFSKVDDNWQIQEVREKQKISTYANIGAYYYSQFGDFLWAVDQMKAKGRTVNDEYYVGPSYNELLAREDTIYARECDCVWRLGTPDAVEHFEENFQPD